MNLRNFGFTLTLYSPGMTSNAKTYWFDRPMPLSIFNNVIAPDDRLNIRKGSMQAYVSLHCKFMAHIFTEQKSDEKPRICFIHRNHLFAFDISNPNDLRSDVRVGLRLVRNDP